MSAENLVSGLGLGWDASWNVYCVSSTDGTQVFRIEVPHVEDWAKSNGLRGVQLDDLIKDRQIIWNGRELERRMTVIDNSADFVSGTPIKGVELLIGCGNSRKKQLAMPDHGEDWRDVVTLDIDPNCGPDVTWDLEWMGTYTSNGEVNGMDLPFEDDTFEELHAYEVLEHVGQQGDWRTFFRQFSEFHRILKPGGKIFGVVPTWDSLWAWGDPGHTRVINEGTLTFLSQKAYEDDVGQSTMTDYRHVYKADFEIEGCQEANGRLCFVLKAI